MSRNRGVNDIAGIRADVGVREEVVEGRGGRRGCCLRQGGRRGVTDLGADSADGVNAGVDIEGDGIGER